MAFTVPRFNLTANIWRLGGAGGAYVTPDVVTACNLSAGRRVVVASGIVAGNLPVAMEILLPKLTDIRAQWNSLSADLVEAPAGSQRFYVVRWVDDVGKGFLNEYRIALMAFLNNGAPVFGFIVPTPLP